MNHDVNVTKRVKTSQGLRYCPIVLSANGRIRPDWVLVNGKEERHSEGAYYLEWREGTKRTRLSVGNDPATATARRLQKEAELNAKNHGVEVVPAAPQNGNNGHRSLSTAMAEFLEETKLTKKPKTLAAYTTALDYFTESCSKQYLEEIERRDLLKFAAFLRDQKDQAPRSCWNKFSNVMSFLKVNGIRGVVKKTDWPRYTEEEPEIYEQEELDTLFKASDDQERLWFEFFLMTGMREQEVMYTYWSDINLKHATVRITHKPDRVWTPKAYKEREIPIPSNLVESLTAWKSKAKKGCNLLFPTAGCNPKLNFLDDLKAVAERAKLDKDDFWLHKFRATFATRCLWAGVDLRTVQQWLGHSDMESTMRYLKPHGARLCAKRSIRFSEGKMETKNLGERSGYQLMSLASRIKAIHHAMTAEELADLLKVSRLTILRRAKRGTIPSFRVGSCVRFDPANISRWLVDMGVKRMSKP